jgi:hypothetical protein
MKELEHAKLLSDGVIWSSITSCHLQGAVK